MSRAYVAFKRSWEHTACDPMRDLRERLTDAKRRGVPFDDAWWPALDAVDWGGRNERKVWEKVMRDPDVYVAWWAAYDDVPERADVFAELRDGWQDLETRTVAGPMNPGALISSR